MLCKNFKLHGRNLLGKKLSVYSHEIFHYIRRPQKFIPAKFSKFEPFYIRNTARKKQNQY